MNNKSKQPILLLKISEEKYLLDTINNGTFYMNTLQYYRNLEWQENNKIVGDKKEGAMPENKVFFMGMEDGTYQRMNVQFYPKRNTCIYCALGVSFDYNYLSENNFKYIINKKYFKNFVNENCKLLIFTDVKKTLDKILNCVKDKGYKQYKESWVKYEPFFSSEDDNSLDFCFHKRNEYSYQNEYRIAVENYENKPISNIKIGKLDDDEYILIDIEKNKHLEFLFNGYTEGNLVVCTEFAYKWI